MQVHANRSAQGLTGANIETAIVPWALYDVIHHQSVFQMDLFMRAQPIGAINVLIEHPINGIGLAVVVETHHVLFFQILESTDVNFGQFPLQYVQACLRLPPTLEQLREALAE